MDPKILALQISLYAAKPPTLAEPGPPRYGTVVHATVIEEPRR